MNKHREGRDEPILDPHIEIIDSHHHLFVRPGMQYLLDDYIEDIKAGHNVVASVYVETQYMARMKGPKQLRSIGEVEFANHVAMKCTSTEGSACKVAAAIVGYADMRLGVKVAETLDSSISVATDRFRGVRQVALAHEDPNVLRFINPVPPQDLMQSSQFSAGLRQLAQRGLSFDAAVFHYQLEELAVHARKNPDVTFVLNHMGMAMSLDMDVSARNEVFEAWRKAMRFLAQHENVYCKIGGLGLAYWGFGFDSTNRIAGYLELSNAWRPYVETAIDCFGTKRCMMESDYPPDGRSCGFVPLWNALKHIVKDYSAEDKAALFSKTAAEVYRIEL